MLGTRASVLALSCQAGKKSKSGLFFWRSNIVGGKYGQARNGTESRTDFGGDASA